MSFVFATPEYVSAAASELANIGSTVSSANAAASGPTSSVLAAGADEVSVTVASLFDAHAQVYQALSAQAALFHQQFVQLMSGGAAQYALAEAANATPLQIVEQGVMSGVSAPMQALAAVPASGSSTTGALTAAASGAPASFGAGGSGATGQLVSTVGAGPAAAAVDSGGAVAFGPGGAGYTGSPLAVQSLGGTPAGGAAIGSAVGAAGSAEELGIAETPAAAAPASAVTPLATVPPTAQAAPAAAVRPGTPAYSPATAAAAEPSEE